MVGEMQEECKVGKKQSVFKETVAVPKSQSLIPYRKRKGYKTQTDKHTEVVG